MGSGSPLATPDLVVNQGHGGTIEPGSPLRLAPTRPGGAYTRLHTNPHPPLPSWGSSLGAPATETYARLCLAHPFTTLNYPALPPDTVTDQLRAASQTLAPSFGVISLIAREGLDSGCLKQSSFV